jgi:hypothetical protein
VEANDLHPVPDLIVGVIFTVAQATGDHRDRVLVGERLAELREEVSGRLHAGVVVLVEDEESTA